MKKPKELYLEEDKDLLTEMEHIGPGTSQTASILHGRKISEIQIKAILRNRKTLIDLDESNKNLSLILFYVAIIGLLIAALQFVLDIFNSPNKIFGSVISLILFVAIIVITRNMDRILEERTNKS